MEQHLLPGQLTLKGSDRGKLMHVRKHHPVVSCKPLTINDPVQRSAPVRMIMHKPYGKTRALIVRIRPGAFSWNHGVVPVLRTVPQAKASRHPAETEERKTLSRRMCPRTTPDRATVAKTSGGVRASKDMADIVIDSMGYGKASYTIVHSGEAGERRLGCNACEGLCYM